jgi:hypothetical protein
MPWVISDLKQTCPQCLGSGRQPGVQQWGITQINPGARCLTCEGRGFLLTQLGKDVIDLLRPFVEKIVADGLKAEAERRDPD